MVYRRVCIVGLGGIGGYLLPPLLTYLNNKKDLPNEVLLVDGDVVQESNLTRQPFTPEDLGKSKAEAWAQRFGYLDRLSIRPFEEFLKMSNLDEVIIDKSIVFSCVDNHYTRRLLHDASADIKNILIVSGGNEYTDGNAQIFLKERGKEKTPQLIHMHPEIEFPEDRSPDDMSCEELIASEPQLVFTNLMAASVMLMAFWQTLEGKRESEIYFDLNRGRVTPAERMI